MPPLHCPTGRQNRTIRRGRLFSGTVPNRTRSNSDEKSGDPFRLYTSTLAHSHTGNRLSTCCTLLAVQLVMVPHFDDRNRADAPQASWTHAHQHPRNHVISSRSSRREYRTRTHQPFLRWQNVTDDESAVAAAFDCGCGEVDGLAQLCIPDALRPSSTSSRRAESFAAAL